MLNKVQLIGVLQKKNKKEYIKIQNQQVAKVDFVLSVTVNHKTENFFCVVYNQQAEDFILRCFVGSMIYIEGKLMISRFFSFKMNRNNIVPKIIVSKIVTFDKNETIKNKNNYAFNVNDIKCLIEKVKGKNE